MVVHQHQRLYLVFLQALADELPALDCAYLISHLVTYEIDQPVY